MTYMFAGVSGDNSRPSDLFKLFMKLVSSEPAKRPKEEAREGV